MYSIKNVYNIISISLIIVYFIYILINSPPRTYKNAAKTNKTIKYNKYNKYNWNQSGIINKNNCYSYATDVLDFNDKKLPTRTIIWYYRFISLYL